MGLGGAGEFCESVKNVKYSNYIPILNISTWKDANSMATLQTIVKLVTK